MPDFEADDGFISQDQGTIYDYEASLGEYAGAAFQRQMDTNPLQFILREGAFLSEDFQSIAGYAERVDAKSAREEVARRGLKLDIPDGGITRYELDALQYLKQREINQTTTMARRSGALTTAAGFAAGLAAGATDPLNVASAFIPVVKEARYAAWLAKTESFAGRAAIRAGVGATEGAVGAALIEPIVYAGATAEQFDYTGADSFLNVMFGTVLGGGLHVAGGATFDIRNAKTIEALKALDPGLQSLSLRQAAAAAPESVHLDATMQAVRALEDDAPVRAAETFEAWHGSPNIFESFDSAKIGSGNNTNYGHGVYLSSAERIAGKFRGDVDGAGALYRVQIAAKEDELLDWDKPLREQSASVQSALNKVFGEPAEAAEAVQLSNGRWVLKSKGGEIIGRKDGWPTRGDAEASKAEIDARRPRSVESIIIDNRTGLPRAGNEELSKRLRAAGIKGIKYGHRALEGDDGGKANFVIFDPNDLQILSRNGQPKSQLGDLIEKAKQERTADAFNRQFVDDPADVEASRQADEAVAKSEDVAKVVEDTAFLDAQINGLKSREMWTKADDAALEAGEMKAAELERAASIYRAAAVCMAE